MVNKDFFAALSDLASEKGIEQDVFIEALEAGLAAAFKRETGEARPIHVKTNVAKNEIKAYAYKVVKSEVTDEDKEIDITEAQDLKKSYKEGDWVLEDVTPKSLSRIAIQTAKQVIMQRLNDFRKDKVMAEMSDHQGEIAAAKVRRIDGDSVYVEIISTQMEGVMGPQDRVTSEKYNIGSNLKVYVKSTRQTSHGPQVSVSRSHPNFVRRLFELQVPEIASGDVEIKSIVRDAGNRTKMAVYCENPNIDAVGSCIGQRGQRINAVVEELNNEKVDVIPWSEDPLEFVARALSPAKVLMVQMGDVKDSARAIVPDDKLSLAIGKGGQNVRLAAKLTGWKIDVKPYSQIVNINELDIDSEEDEQEIED